MLVASQLRDVLSALRTRLENNPDYARSVATSYSAALLNVVVQVVLVPLYLHYLGKPQFGLLMIILATINYLAIGVTWAGAGVQRVMGEMAALGDTARLNECYGLAKLIFIGFAALTGIVTLSGLWFMQDQWHTQAGLDKTDVYSTAVAATAYFLVFYDFNVDRLTLIAAGRQALANILAMLAQLVFVIGVIPVLAAGGGLVEIMMMLLPGHIIARLVSWHHLRRMNIRWGRVGATGLATLRRIAGPMGLGYAAYGLLFMSLLQGDILILGWLGNATLVAEFVLVWKIADVLIQLLWRIPESLVPYLVQMDARNEHDKLARIYSDVHTWMVVGAVVAGTGFAVFGPYVVSLWVGAENAPDNAMAYILAGGAVFWLVSARLPVIFAYSLLRLRSLNQILALELGGKLLLTLVLFPHVGMLAPLIAINVIHACGINFLYRRAGQSTLDIMGHK